MGGWLNIVWSAYPVFSRLLPAAEILLAVFMLLFLLTGYSPELKLCQKLDPAILSLPLGLKGLLSAWAATAPICIALCQAIFQLKPLTAIFYFTNVFFGNVLVLLPLMLNMQWSKTVYYQIISRLIILFCAISIIYSGIARFLES
ncbi:MAG: hypothetical protein AB1439_02550 [candidate division FCPU426 bacterium]